MPFNGAGMFVRVRNWVADATAGIKIRADYHDIEDDGFAAGLSQCIAKDGQTTVTNNIPMNGKRLVALSDPIDPQDASSKAYADTKLPLAGGTITGNLIVTGSLTVNSVAVAQGYRTRQGLPGPLGGNYFNFNYTGNLEAWVDNTNLGALATQAYVEQRASDWAHAIADPKVNRAGDTLTGQLTTATATQDISGGSVMGTLMVMGHEPGITFHSPGVFAGNFGMATSGDFYCGGYSFGAGQAFVFWTSKNLTPIKDGRLALAGNNNIPIVGAVYEPFNGAVVTGLQRDTGAAGGPVNVARWRYLQLLTPGGWYTVGYA